jgi:PAS domain-containing protein
MITSPPGNPASLPLAGAERVMGADDLIVSKTNLKGHLTYANDVFLNIADFTEREVLGKPHSVIRNAAMPRCVFRLLWNRIEAGQEIFAYVVNSSKHGDYYWVFAHVTPSFDTTGQCIGYHSNRRKPAAAAIAKIAPIYRRLLDEEARHRNGKEAVAASMSLLNAIIDEAGGDYDRFVLSL